MRELIVITVTGKCTMKNLLVLALIYKREYEENGIFFFATKITKIWVRKKIVGIIIEEIN